MILTFIGKRLEELRKKKGLTQETIANHLGISRSAYIGYEQGKHDPRGSLLKKMANFFGITTSEFLGEENTNQNLKILTFPVTKDGNEHIVYVPEEAKAGYLEGYKEVHYVKELHSFSLPRHEHGTFRAFEIKGDSMPPINQGFIVIGQYAESIISGKRYILTTDEEGIVFKRVYLQGSQIILISDNPYYEPYTIELKQVKELWQFYSFIGFPEYEGPIHQQILTRLAQIDNKLTASSEK